MLKNNLRHVKLLKVQLNRNLLELGSTKPEVVRSSSATAAKERAFIEKMKAKQGNKLIGYSQMVALFGKGWLAFCN